MINRISPYIDQAVFLSKLVKREEAMKLTAAQLNSAAEHGEIKITSLRPTGPNELEGSFTIPIRGKEYGFSFRSTLVNDDSGVSGSLIILDGSIKGEIDSSARLSLRTQNPREVIHFLNLINEAQVESNRARVEDLHAVSTT